MTWIPIGRNKNGEMQWRERKPNPKGIADRNAGMGRIAPAYATDKNGEIMAAKRFIPIQPTVVGGPKAQPQGTCPCCRGPTHITFESYPEMIRQGHLSRKRTESCQRCGIVRK